MIKPSVRASSWIAAVTAWLLLSMLAVFVIKNLKEKAVLIRDNTNERLINTLVTSLWNYDDFGSAIESSEVLKESIRGFAIYGSDFFPLYQWGKVPERLDEALSGRIDERTRIGRYTIPDPKNRSVQFILKTWEPAPQSPVGPPRNSAPPGPRQPQNADAGRPEPPIMRQGNRRYVNLFGNYFYIDISQPDYWRTMTVTALVLPFCVITIGVLLLSVRNLYMRNREYRERIEAQKNLVVLGTAAGTLAHEIKNPLSSIRLQTGLLARLYTGQGGEELAIINEEVDRLSELTYRVNDYLREGKGNPSAVNMAALAAETGRRLCRRDIVTEDSAKDAVVFADIERTRSVLENLIRNALESGSPAEEVGVSVGRSEGNVTVTVYDRGQGIAEGDMGRVFDPFFTRKSAGTGIGLSICKRFIEAAGGTIVIKNREGGGAQVVVSLPEYTPPEGN
jgi:two-component system sensor histidine kinase HydH